MDKGTHALMDRSITQSLLSVAPQAWLQSLRAWGGRGMRNFPRPVSAAAGVPEPSSEGPCSGLVGYLLGATAKRPGILKYTEIALL